jgi:methionine sulfoxide reductase heme-binding subunit
LGLAAAVLAAGIEYAWYGVATGINPLRVVSAEWALRFGIRPAQWVAISGAMIAALATAWRAARQLRGRAGPPTMLRRASPQRGIS